MKRKNSLGWLLKDHNGVIKTVSRSNRITIGVLYGILGLFWLVNVISFPENALLATIGLIGLTICTSDYAVFRFDRTSRRFGFTTVVHGTPPENVELHKDFSKGIYSIYVTARYRAKQRKVLFPVTNIIWQDKDQQSCEEVYTALQQALQS